MISTASALKNLKIRAQRLSAKREQANIISSELAAVYRGERSVGPGELRQLRDLALATNREREFAALALAEVAMEYVEALENGKTGRSHSGKVSAKPKAARKGEKVAGRRLGGQRSR